jgi:hypothetical protein
MLGVTVFGIFLTPVFFYVIEGFVETPLFASARMHMVGKIALFAAGILSLGLLWVLIWVLGGLLRSNRLRSDLKEKRLAALDGATREVNALINGDGPNGAAKHMATLPTNGDGLNGHTHTNGDDKPADGAPEHVQEK